MFDRLLLYQWTVIQTVRHQTIDLRSAAPSEIDAILKRRVRMQPTIMRARIRGRARHLRIVPGSTAGIFGPTLAT